MEEMTLQLGSTNGLVQILKLFGSRLRGNVLPPCPQIVPGLSVRFLLSVVLCSSYEAPALSCALGAP